MNEENRLIIKQLNKFGRIPETSELLKMIEDLEKERTMYKTSFEEMSKNYFELQNNWNELNKFIEEEKNRLATQVSNTYKDSLDKIHFVNEDIFNELTKVSGKMQELED